MLSTYKAQQRSVTCYPMGEFKTEVVRKGLKREGVGNDISPRTIQMYLLNYLLSTKEEIVNNCYVTAEICTIETF